MSLPPRETFRLETLNRLIEASDMPVRMLIEEVRHAEEFIYGAEDKPPEFVDPGHTHIPQCLSMHCPNWRNSLKPAP